MIADLKSNLSRPRVIRHARWDVETGYSVIEPAANGGRIFVQRRQS